MTLFRSNGRRRAPQPPAQPQREPEMPPRPAAYRASSLPADHMPWSASMTGAVNPEFDPCGAPPIGGKP